jgi:hypothetical protein
MLHQLTSSTAPTCALVFSETLYEIGCAYAKTLTTGDHNSDSAM